MFENWQRKLWKNFSKWLAEVKDGILTQGHKKSPGMEMPRLLSWDDGLSSGGTGTAGSTSSARTTEGETLWLGSNLRLAEK